MASLEDIPSWAVQEAMRRWYRSECGGKYVYTWQPGPAALREVSMSRTRRFTLKETERARKAAKFGPQGLAKWVDEFYASQTHTLEELLTEAVALQLARNDGKGDALDLARKLAAEYVERSKAELLDLPASDLASKLEALAFRWERERPSDMAKTIEALGPGSNGNA